MFFKSLQQCDHTPTQKKVGVCVCGFSFTFHFEFNFIQKRERIEGVVRSIVCFIFLSHFIFLKLNLVMGTIEAPCCCCCGVYLFSINKS
jgi:hypothetical protein